MLLKQIKAWSPYSLSEDSSVCNSYDFYAVSLWLQHRTLCVFSVSVWTLTFFSLKEDCFPPGKSFTISFLIPQINANTTAPVSILFDYDLESLTEIMTSTLSPYNLLSSCVLKR